jgi:hypothetical protein
VVGLPGRARPGVGARARGEGDDRASSNWPGRGWPTVETLEQERRRHPLAMFPTADYYAAAEDPAEDERICKASVVWAMQRESEMVK